MTLLKKIIVLFSFLLVGIHAYSSQPLDEAGQTQKKMEAAADEARKALKQMAVAAKDCEKEMQMISTGVHSLLSMMQKGENYTHTSQKQNGAKSGVATATLTADQMQEVFSLVAQAPKKQTDGRDEEVQRLHDSLEELYDGLDTEFNELEEAAIGEPNNEKLKALLARPNSKDLLKKRNKKGDTILYHVAGRAPAENLRLLLAHNAQVVINAKNKNNGTPLVFAVASNKEENARVLLAAKADVGIVVDDEINFGSILLNAAITNSQSLTQLILEKMFDSYNRSTLLDIEKTYAEVKETISPVTQQPVSPEILNQLKDALVRAKILALQHQQVNQSKEPKSTVTFDVNPQDKKVKVTLTSNPADVKAHRAAARALRERIREDDNQKRDQLRAKREAERLERERKNREEMRRLQDSYKERKKREKEEQDRITAENAKRTGTLSDSDGKVSPTSSDTTKKGAQPSATTSKTSTTSSTNSTSSSSSSGSLSSSSSSINNDVNLTRSARHTVKLSQQYQSEWDDRRKEKTLTFYDKDKQIFEAMGQRQDEVRSERRRRKLAQKKELQEKRKKELADAQQKAKQEKVKKSQHAQQNGHSHQNGTLDKAPTKKGGITVYRTPEQIAAKRKADEEKVAAARKAELEKSERIVQDLLAQKQHHDELEKKKKERDEQLKAACSTYAALPVVNQAILPPTPADTNVAARVAFEAAVAASAQQQAPGPKLSPGIITPPAAAPAPAKTKTIGKR